MARIRRATPSQVTAGVAAAAVAEVEDALAAPPDPRAAAFFDVDNTVLRGASLYHLARGLFRRRLLTRGDILRFAVQQVTFRVLGVEDPATIARTRETALAFIADRDVAELTGLAEEIFAEVLASKVWPGTRAFAQMHLDQGQRVWLVTATPVEIANVIAGRLGLTGALGTVAESIGGTYTGRLEGDLLHGPAKAEAVKALAAREGLELARCAAYSDSANDIPMLSLVGSPCAVNPDSRLREHARKSGWLIRDYRSGRRVARVGVPTAAAAGAVAGTGAVLVRRRARRTGASRCSRGKGRRHGG